MISDQITRPTLIIDLKKVRRNIQMMMDKARLHSVKLVPHFKTHQSKEIGELFREAGVNSIMCSSVKMAEYFAENGWKDITVAFPFNVLEIPRINAMINQGADISLFVNHHQTLKALNESIAGEVNAFVEIDAGYNRSGVDVSRVDEIVDLSKAIEGSEKVNFKGFYCHPGNTYGTNSVAEIKAIWKHAITAVKPLKRAAIENGLNPEIRLGDTPGCSVVEDFEGIDQISPGNFVFYDLVMNYLNVCEESDIAVALAAPVVSKNEERMEVILHGGGVHLSKDHLFNANEEKFFGEIVIFNEEGWSEIIEGAHLKSLSQEHGVLKVSKELFDTFQIGDVIGVLPIHSCLTANLMKSYLDLNGNNLEHLEKVF